MRILKQNPILRLVNSYIVDSPQPSNISYLWNFGSLLALCLGIQIITGVFLAFYLGNITDLVLNGLSSSYFLTNNIEFIQLNWISGDNIILAEPLRNVSFDYNYYFMQAISPFFVNGLIDAEGCFTASIVRCKTCRLGWTVKLNFKIKLHIREEALLKAVRDFFNVGIIVLSGNFVSYNVNTINDLAVILNHIRAYPLLTFKHNMAIIFNIIRELMLERQHLNLQGLLLIIAYINVLNNPINPKRLAEIENELGPIPQINLPLFVFISWPLIQSPWWIIMVYCRWVIIYLC